MTSTVPLAFARTALSLASLSSPPCALIDFSIRVFSSWARTAGTTRPSRRPVTAETNRGFRMTTSKLSKECMVRRVAEIIRRNDLFRCREKQGDDDGHLGSANTAAERIHRTH